MRYKNIKLPKYKELAKYLGVSEQAIKQYPKQKRLLMLLGLYLIDTLGCDANCICENKNLRESDI